MDDFIRFMKQNKLKKEVKHYAPTKSLTDENGEPLAWTFRAVSTAENDAIRESCMLEVPVTGKPGSYRLKVNTSKYIAKLIACSVVNPNLNNKELQDSYGVMSAEELIKEMVDNPGEYTALSSFVQNLNGFDISIDDKVEEAKN